MISGQNIVRVPRTKFLGISLDENRSWKYHIDYICNKISKWIGILLRARQVLFGQTLIMLYNTLIKPHFIYGITIWGNTYKKYIHRLHLIQKKAIRIINYSEFCAHTGPLFEKMKLMTIYDLHEYFSGILIYNGLHKKLPFSMCDFFTRSTHERNANLRSLYFRKKFTQFSIKSVGPRLWNSFPINCKQSTSLYSFKKLLRNHIFHRQMTD